MSYYRSRYHRHVSTLLQLVYNAHSVFGQTVAEHLLTIGLGVILQQVSTLLQLVYDAQVISGQKAAFAHHWHGALQLLLSHHWRSTLLQLLMSLQAACTQNTLCL